MTKEQANQYIPLLKAYAEGKTIQYLAASGWMDWEYPSFHEDPESYRIKPEQITMAVWFCPGTDLITENDMSQYSNWRKAIAVLTLE